MAVVAAVRHLILVQVDMTSSLLASGSLGGD